MSAPEPDLETNSSETTPPKIDWRSPRTWAFFIADAAYSGALAGTLVIVACLIAELFYETLDGSFDEWCVIILVTILISVLPRGILHIWLFPDREFRRTDFIESLWDGGNGILIGVLFFCLSLVLYLCLSLPIGGGVFANAHRIFALPDAWRSPQMIGLLCAVILGETGTPFKLLLHRTRNSLGS